MLHTFFSRLLGQFVPVLGENMWTVGLWIAGMVLTGVWAVGLHKKVRQTCAQGSGFVIVPVITMIGISLVYLVIGLTQGLLTGAIVSMFSSLPILGTILNLFPSIQAGIGTLISLITSLVFTIGLILYIVQHSEALAKLFTEQIRKPMVSGYSARYMLTGALGLSWILNHPSINGPTYHAPAIISAMVGLYTLISVRPKWSEIRWNTERSYVVEYGELPRGRKVETTEDEQLMREAMDEIRDYISGDSLADEIERKCATGQRIAEQLGEKFELETAAEATARMQLEVDEMRPAAMAVRVAEEAENARVAERLAELEAKAEAQAEAEAEQEAEAQAEAEAERLH